MNTISRTAREIFDHVQEISSPAERMAFLDQACADSPELRQQVESLLQALEQAGSFLETPPVQPEATRITDPTIYSTANGSFVRPDIANDSSSPDFLLPGDATGTQVGPYRLVEKLGEGGMGAVYLAEQEQPIRRQVALKIIKPGLDSAEVVARFNAERQALTMMEHIHIARVFDAGATEKGLPYFVMELVKGVPMSHFCDENNLSTRERLQLFETVCQAIQHAHQKGIIHRDIKPSNVLVAMHDGKPTAKVIDFGLAKATRQTSLDQTRQMTRFGAVMGTLEYMSPEQADGGTGGLDTRTDVYSLGVMLYELLTGTTPLDFAGQREVGWNDVMLRIKEEDAPKPSSRVAALGPRLEKIAAARKTEPARLAKVLRGELDWIALKSLEKDRDRRYETASALAKDVQRYLDDEAVEACPPSKLYRLGKFARKNRTLLAMTGVIVGSLVIGIIVALIGWDKAKKEQRQAEMVEEGYRSVLAMIDGGIRTMIHKGIKPGSTEKSVLGNMMQAYADIQAVPVTTPEMRARKAEAEYRLGNLAALLGDAAYAEDRYRWAIDLYEQLTVEFKDKAEHRNELARCNFDLGILLNELGRRPEAETAYRRAIELLKTLSVDFPDEASYRSELADAYNNLGSVLRDARGLAKAEKAFLDAMTLDEKLVAELPDNLQIRINLAANYHNLGNAVRDQGKPEAALAWYGKAIARLEPLKPLPDDAKLFLRNAHWDRANALGQLKRHAEAIKDWQRAIDLDEGADREHLRRFLAAARMEEKLKSQGKPAGKLLYDAAAVYSRAIAAAAATGEAGLQEQYTKRALELLEKAKSADYFTDPRRIQEFKKDGNFDPLSKVAEYKKFLKSLDAGK